MQENRSIYLSIYLSIWKPFWKRVYIYIYMLFAGWEVRGRNCARGLEYRQRPLAEGGTQTEDTVSSNTDRPRPVNNIFSFFFFFFWDFKVSGKFSSTLQPMCVEVRCVRVDERRDRLQTKTKRYNTIFSSVIYIMAFTALFWNKERFLCLARQFIIWVSNKGKIIDELDIKSPRKKIQQGFSSAECFKTCFKISSIEWDENRTKAS